MSISFPAYGTSRVPASSQQKSSVCDKTNALCILTGRSILWGNPRHTRLSLLIESGARPRWLTDIADLLEKYIIGEGKIPNGIQRDAGSEWSFSAPSGTAYDRSLNSSQINYSPEGVIAEKSWNVFGAWRSSEARCYTAIQHSIAVSQSGHLLLVTPESPESWAVSWSHSASGGERIALFQSPSALSWQLICP